VAVAQSGPIPDAAPRAENVARLVAMLRRAAGGGADVVVFTECALSAFFPHWTLDHPASIDEYCERSMPNPDVEPLFAEAKRLGVGFCLGYAELAEDEPGHIRHYNTCVLVDGHGSVVGKYRKTHLPGYYVPDHDPAGHVYQNLEKRYFDVGDLGWQCFEAFGMRVGMMICNDRRWAEPWRVLGLQGAECVMLGYNTPTVGVTGVVTEPTHLGMFQNHLSMQAGAYQNSTWVCAAAKAGKEEGVYQMGGSCIIAPTGEIVAQATTGETQTLRRCIVLARLYYWCTVLTT
jgi:predicted amidohydrolase